MPLTVPVLTGDQYVFDFEPHPGPFCTRDLPAATIAQQFVEKLQCQVYKILFDLLLPDDFLTNQTLCIVPDCA